MNKTGWKGSNPKRRFDKRFESPRSTPRVKKSFKPKFSSPGLKLR